MILTKLQVIPFLFKITDSSIHMEFILDDPNIEKLYQILVKKLDPLKNGIVADAMAAGGIKYKMNLGASTTSLQELASKHSRNHLLALKLWNKGWRETMILATLLEEPKIISADQMDYWVKSFENIEIAEQAVMNLFADSPLAFQKASEWSIGKKPLVKSTGLLLMGRLAMTKREVEFEEFESFFEVLPPLSKDPELRTIMVRTLIQLARVNIEMHECVLLHTKNWLTFESQNSKNVANEVLQEIDNDYFQDLIYKN